MSTQKSDILIEELPMPMQESAQIVQDLFSFNDLPYVNSSPDSVRGKFKQMFNNVQPDGIAVNSETYFNAVKPAITEQYGHRCYKVLGGFSRVERDGKPPEQAIVGTNYAYNYSNEEATISLEVKGEWSEQTSWSSSTTTGLTISSEFTLEGVFKMGTSFSITTTVGRSDSKSVTRTVTAGVSVKVPPMSKKKLTMVATMKQGIMDLEAPISVQGSFGANFPKRVNGHYFWFADARSVLNSTSGTLKATVKQVAYFDTHTEVGKAEPI
ncbi:MAG: hypothetical protein JGK17_22650 [Microcoleus sp. PH2017_10_PVI_O_A]|uniref:hypothetical protein n=1 Tax=unclassified Microcoleus TaxID=2642155 RepID=UPI001D4510D6|nr:MULTISPECIES: hypothetical protein [unclassified Microcoleus]MCC3408337.1 hypothetical protein [Microcoleus sp. PH2017_10_PVI_O_A]MCC3462396.1 hypothetical protein [Microcoleus sp. PH2017_11_PCY_U_A]MCC3480886.1 hypothetical protein [Microcoleus sp. PH2017_12_PCY_D_A]MCC3561800.1 hypothetical protein [Microcoleus sp. PH2017_27_LUM_O_A]